MLVTWYIDLNPMLFVTYGEYTIDMIIAMKYQHHNFSSGGMTLFRWWEENAFNLHFWCCNCMTSIRMDLWGVGGVNLKQIL